MTSAPKLWGDALRLLQNEIPDFAYEAWIAPLAVKHADTCLVLGCPTSFHRERVRRHYANAIAACWEKAWREGAERGEDHVERVCVPAISIVDSREFAETEGQRFEVKLPVRRTEQSGLAGGVMRVVRDARTGVVTVAREATGNALCTPSLPAAIPASTSFASPLSIAPSARRLEGSGRAALPSSAVRSSTDLPSSCAPDADGESRPTERTTRSATAFPARSRARATLSEAERSARALATAEMAGRPRLTLDGEKPTPGELPFTFESFVVGPCNALAREAALALARRRQSSLNLLYLSGESGTGKTHLARAAANEARRHAGASRENLPGRAVVYATAEQFTSEFVTAMRTGRTESFHKRYRGPIGLLVVEDVQFFDGRMKTQLELFHTVQHVLDAGGSVLITGDRRPHELKGLAERMRGQIGRGFVAELERPDPVVRRHILRAKAAAGGFHLSPDCLDLLVESTSGSVREVESVLIQVVTTASLLGRPIDVDLTRESIARKAGTDAPVARRRVDPAEIVRIVAAFVGRPPEALASRSRRRDTLVPRQLAMFLSHRYTDASYAEIGRALGRDHPSVRNAIQRIERLVVENAPLRYQVEALSERIDQALAAAAPAPAAR